MNRTLWAWLLSAVVLVVAARWMGRMVRGTSLGILVDNRGRFSLSHLQVVSWSIVVLSLIAGVFLGRLFDGAASTALEFSIPDELLLVMGISIGSAVGASAIKATKDQARPSSIAASDETDRPRAWQLFTIEEGTLADRAIDIAKFQSFWFTALLLLGYVAMTVKYLQTANLPVAALPGFSDGMITLLAISHAGYLAGKLPAREGTPAGLTVAGRASGAVPGTVPLAQAATPVITYVPRNPPPHVP